MIILKHLFDVFGAKFGKAQLKSPLIFLKYSIFSDMLAGWGGFKGTAISCVGTQNKIRQYSLMEFPGPGPGSLVIW